jgi:hypothetical protein
MAVLHIILGITKKIFDELVIQLQKVDSNDDSNERMGLTEIRDSVLEEANRLGDELTTIKERVKESDTERKSLWTEVQEALREMPPDFAKIGELRDKHKAAVQSLKETTAVAASSKDTTMKDALDKVVEDINMYLSHSRGRYEASLEKTISNQPIKAKHNPFYSGAFNGNDCFRLMENNELLFKELRKVAEDEVDRTVETKVNDIADKYEEVFQAWAEVLPLFRSTKLLPEVDRELLNTNIELFIEAYLEKTQGSITVKIHHLMEHTKRLISTTGTVGFWSEDPVESIHAVFNILGRRYASLDRTKRTEQIHRALQQKKVSADRDMAQKKAAGREPKKRARRQGRRKDAVVPENVIADDGRHLRKEVVENLLMVIEDHNEGDDNEGEDAAGSSLFPDMILMTCLKCRTANDSDRWVPDWFDQLHICLCHNESGTKFVGNKKQKTD